MERAQEIGAVEHRFIDTQGPADCWIRRMGKEYCCVISAVILIVEAVFAGTIIAVIAITNKNFIGWTVGASIIVLGVTALVLWILFRRYISAKITYENEAVAKD
ncbi:hypothetical protein K0U07_02120 [bacterium]|nr:hypothetical protein [bacterium]